MRFVGVVIVLFGLVYIGRLYQLQVMRGQMFLDQADRQYAATPGSLYERGSIYFTNKDGGRQAAATLATGFTIAMNPGRVTDPEGAYEALSPYLDLNEYEFVETAQVVGDPYEEIARRVSKETMEAVMDQEVSGIQAYREQWRYYPGGTLAAHVLGFIGYVGNDYSGRYGLERYYDEQLGRDDSDVYTNFFAEILGGVGDFVFSQTKGRAADVVLTIEPRVQTYIEDQLAKLASKWGSKEAGAIIIDPKTGEIIALAAVPTFDLNNFSDVSGNQVYSNPLVERVYEMGSIMKPLTMAAGLDAEVINANTTYYDAGSLEADGFTIANYDGKGRGYVDMQEVLSQSLNTGTVFVEKELGHSRFRNYIHDYGLSEKTGIDLPGEVSGLTDNLESKKDIEFYTASFGQGIAVSPIAMVRALGVLANGGFLIKPRVTKQLDFELGFTEEIKTTEQGRVISRKASDEITRMLVKVVDEALLGGVVKNPRYSVAAKTGTAQIADRVNGGYYDDRFLHSFFGYFPAYEPEFLIFFYHLEPVGARYASETLTYPFIDTVKFLTSYYEVPPDR